MKKKTIKSGKLAILLLLVATFAIVVFLVSEVTRGSRSVFANFDSGEQKTYNRIQIGTNKEDVIQLLGDPLSKSEIFSLPQRQGFEHFFEAAEQSSAVEYLLWINGMNWYYCIGFDDNGAVVVKGEGHS